MVSGVSVSHLLILLLILAWLAVTVAALTSIAKNTTISGTEKAIWVLICLAFTVLGPIAWFFFGPGAKSSRG